MKQKLVTIALAFGALLTTACKSDVDDLWDQIDSLEGRIITLETTVSQLNTNVESLKTIVDALNNGWTISSVIEYSSYYNITFDNGRSILLNKDASAVSTPVISVKADADGVYYWTVDGNWLTVDGKKVCATGEKGEKGDKGDKGDQGETGATGETGAAGITPQLRINETTNEWEISTDSGTTWTSTGVKATGSAGDSFFKSVASGDDEVTFTLADGTSFTLPKTDSVVPSFEVEDGSSFSFAYEETKTYNVTAKNIESFSISKPDGWKVSYTDATLTITSPAAENTYAETTGDVSIFMVAKNGKSAIAKFPVSIHTGD